LLDNDIGWVFDRGRMYGPREDGNHLYALTTCVAYDLMALKNAEAADRPVAALRVGYPNASDAEVLDVTVVAWPKVTFLIEGGHVHDPAGQSHVTAQPGTGRRPDPQRLADDDGGCCATCRPRRRPRPPWVPAG